MTRIVLGALIAVGALASPQAQKKIYVAPVTSVVEGTETDHTALVMNELRKRCPAAVVLTESPSSADLILRYRLKGSTLANQSGDILFTSGASRYTSVAKDVCKFIEGM